MPPLENNEEMLYTARKHWFVLLGETVFLCLFALLPIVFFVAPHFFPAELSRTLESNLQFQGDPILAVIFLWALELLALWVTFFLLWTDYYLDVWFITNHRVIAIGQHGLFNRHISTFRLDMIQDATVKVPGILATFLRFGTVEISTASDGKFAFRGVANPNQLKEKIMEEHHRVQLEKQEVFIKSAEKSSDTNPQM